MNYVIYPHPSGIVMTTAAEYEAGRRSWSTLKSAKTWGEFLDAQPADERRRIISDHDWMFGNAIQPANKLDPEDDADPDLVHRDTPFTPENMPGFCDGDYPNWPAEESSISDGICRQVLRKFGERQVGFQQTFWILRKRAVPAARAWLEARGHTLVESPAPGQ